MKNKKSPWKTLSSKVIYKNPWLSLREDRVIQPNGKPGIYSVVKTRGVSVFVIAINDSKQVCFVQQYRYPIKTWSWELPAGNSDGQPPLQSAKRELWEETGFTAKHWKKLGYFYPATGMFDEKTVVFYATGLTQTGKDKKIDDGIENVKFYSLPALLKLINDHKITDGQTIACLFFAQSRTSKLL